MNNVGHRIMIQYLGLNELSVSEIHEDVVELFGSVPFTTAWWEKVPLNKLRQSESHGRKL